MSNVVLVSHDQVRKRMAAPGIRCLEMARALAAAGHRVTLSIPNEPEIAADGVRQIRGGGKPLSRSIAEADVVIVGGSGHQLMPTVRVPRGIPRVVDLSFPVILEVLAVPRVRRAVWPPAVPPRALIRRVSRNLLEADLLVCASAQQRDFYLGWLTRVGRCDSSLLGDDPAMARLLTVAPFGCPDLPPARTGPGPRQLISGLSDGDYVLLWSGAMAEWYDPETVVRAVALAAQQIKRVRLVFMGANPGDRRHLPQTETAGRVRELARAIDVLDKHVFFEDQWIPYEQRADWLCDADVAVVASPRTVESELAVRTRFLDYIWAGLPVICTRGGSNAEAVERSRLGSVVAPGDVEAMRDAIISLADPARRAAARKRIDSVRHQHTWSRTMEPLVTFCDDPRVAPDRRRGRRLSYPRLHLDWLRASEAWHSYPRRVGAQTIRWVRRRLR